jgi:DNA mismatch endonuclease, patch repair protein
VKISDDDAFVYRTKRRILATFERINFFGMADVFGKEVRSFIMSRVRSKDTKPEKFVRRLVFALGYRYRLHQKSLPGTPDLVFKRLNKVIFINGCFWHGHHCRPKAPQTNSTFWLNKIVENRKRDQRNLRKLRMMGWSYLVIWECTIHEMSTVKRIEKFLSH